MIYGKFRKTFDIENDTFRLEFLLVPVIGLSFLENYSFTPLEVREGGEPSSPKMGVPLASIPLACGGIWVCLL